MVKLPVLAPSMEPTIVKMAKKEEPITTSPAIVEAMAKVLQNAKLLMDEAMGEAIVAMVGKVAREAVGKAMGDTIGKAIIGAREVTMGRQTRLS